MEQQTEQLTEHNKKNEKDRNSKGRYGAVKSSKATAESQGEGEEEEQGGRRRNTEQLEGNTEEL